MSANLQLRTAKVIPPVRRIFDCCIYNGEIELLSVRFHELDTVVEQFVVVESNLTVSGLPREISFNPLHPSFAPFSAKIRHVIVADMPDTNDPWVREVWQRNAVLRGVPDAAATDLIMMSDADEIPSLSAVLEMMRDNNHVSFGFRLAFHYFYVNYRNVAGPESALIWTVAATRQTLDTITPDALRYEVRDGRTPARIFEQGGWHFSYLMDEAGIRRKVAAFSHQEFNNESFLGEINIAAMVREGRDLFNRPGFVWKLIPDHDLPAWLRQNRKHFRHLFQPANFGDKIRGRIAQAMSSFAQPRKVVPPVVICPYLYDNEAAEIRSKFSFGSKKDTRMELFLWQDKDRIGPEFAFEHCWNLFPDRDVIIVHSDMAPMPGASPSGWFDDLCRYRDALPAAGMIACNLYYPQPAGQPARVQCAGGTFEDGKIAHMHGAVLSKSEGESGVFKDLLTKIRPVDWVTFGGVLIRRDVIRACGPFDRRYKWAYVMDVDYSFEARLRGFRLVQVPVSLQHEESRTTGSLFERTPELKNHITENFNRFYEKWKPFYPALPSEAQIDSALQRLRA